jgi:hypothetical protein
MATHKEVCIQPNAEVESNLRWGWLSRSARRASRLSGIARTEQTKYMYSGKVVSYSRTL